MVFTIFTLIFLCLFLAYKLYKEKTVTFSLRRRNFRLIESLKKKDEENAKSLERISRLELDASNRFIQDSIVHAQSSSRAKEGDIESIVAPIQTGRLLQ